MLIQKIKVNKLRPAEYNPRKDLTPNDEEYKKIKRSIIEFGCVAPIIVNKDMTVIGGHQRLKVLEELGYTEIECNIVDLDKNKEKALNIALNKISGEWDNDKLEELLVELKETDIDMNMTGFSFDEVDNILKDVIGSKEDDFDTDKALEEIKDPVTKLGNIWILDSHKLMCGDSTKKEDIDKLMNNNLADMVFTDPPYNADYSSRVDKNRRKPWGGILNDNMTKEAFDDFLIDFNSIMWEVVKENASIYECIDWKHYSQLESVFKEAFNQKSTIVWNKNYFGLGTYYRTKYELILFGIKGEKVATWNANHDEMDVWDIERENINNYRHPTQKPIDLIVRAIKNSSNENDLILDLFGGSGSTLIAAEQTKRICYIMELDPRYCDVIIKRWENLTGKRAILQK